MVTEKDIREMLTNLEKWIDGKIKDYELVSKRHNDPEIIENCMRKARKVALDFMEKKDYEKASRLLDLLIDYKKDSEDLFLQARLFQTQGKLYLACIYYAFAACVLIESDIENVIDDDYVYEFRACIHLALIYSSSKKLGVYDIEYNSTFIKLEGDVFNDFNTEGMKKFGISRDFNDKRRQSAEFFIWKLLIKYVDIVMNDETILSRFKDKLSFLKYAYARVIFILKSRNKNSLLEQYIDEAKNIGHTQNDLDKTISKFSKGEQPVSKEDKPSQLKHERSDKQDDKRQPKKSKPAAANNELTSRKEEKKKVEVSEQLSSESTVPYQRQYNYKLNLATPIEKTKPTQPSLDVSQYLKSPIKRAENLRLRTTPESDDNNKKIGFLAE